MEPDGKESSAQETHGLPDKEQRVTETVGPKEDRTEQDITKPSNEQNDTGILENEIQQEIDPQRTQPIDMPETTQANIPGTTPLDMPETTLPDMTETTEVETPETTQVDIPETTLPDMTETTEVETPETTQVDNPETTLPDMTETTEDEIPETDQVENPETDQVDIPEPTLPDMNETRISDIPENEIPIPDIPEIRTSDALETTEVSEESLTLPEFIDEELLWVIIENHGEDLLVFIKDKECSLAQEVLSILEEYSESNMDIEVVDVNEMTSVAEDFGEALNMFTENELPVVFYKKKYVGNYYDIVNSSRFNRLDLILNPPLCPYYHIVIVGSGPGAQAVLTELERFGKSLKFALVDWTAPMTYGSGLVLGLGSQGNLPRNLLWNAIREAQAAQEAEELLSDEDLSPDDLSEIWDEATTTMYNEISWANWAFRKRLASAGIDFYRGSIEFVGRDTLNIAPCYDDDDDDESSDSSTCEEEEYSEDGRTNIVGMTFIICGGVVPRISEFPGFEYCVSIERFLYEEEFPATALIIGNTPEVFETAHLIASYGGEVTVMNKSDRWLPSYDQECIEKVIHGFKNLDVKFLKISRIKHIREMKSGYKVRVKLENGKHYTRLYLTVIVDFTRRPISSHINLEVAGVTLDRLTRKVIVSEEFRTTNQSIWAFGSIARGHLGTPHFEILAGKRVINLILNGYEDVPMPKIFPRILLTPLEYGFVGETEKSAKIKYKSKVTIYESESHLLSFPDPEGDGTTFQMKIICTANWHCFHKEKVERVIGIHFLGKNASRLITGFASSLEKGITKRDFVEQVSVKGSTELGLHHSELRLKNVSEKKTISASKELIKQNEYVKRNIPYRCSEKPPFTSQHMEPKKVISENLQPDANQPIDTSNVTDLWAVELTETSATGTASTDTLSIKLIHSSSESSLESDTVDRQPSYTTIYTSYTRISDLGESHTSEESSETESDRSLSPIKPSTTSVNSSLEGEASKVENHFDGCCSRALIGYAQADAPPNPDALEFLVAVYLLPFVIVQASTYSPSNSEIYLVLSEPVSEESLSYVETIAEIRRSQIEFLLGEDINQFAFLIGLYMLPFLIGLSSSYPLSGDEVSESESFELVLNYETSSGSSDEDDPNLPYPILRINHLLHD